MGSDRVSITPSSRRCEQNFELDFMLQFNICHPLALLDAKLYSLYSLFLSHFEEKFKGREEKQVFSLHAFFLHFLFINFYTALLKKKNARISFGGDRAK